MATSPIDLARRIRLRSLEMIHRVGSAHAGSSLSMADLLAVLYSGVLRVDPAQPDQSNRDRFLLSKGHACAALYAVLAERGFFPLEWLDRYYLDGSPLAGHATHKGVPGVEASTGSLGHGVPLGVGMALAGKRAGAPYRVFVLVSDGECDEGTVWESALFAAHHGLDNLVLIIDYNKIQSLGRVEDVLRLEPFAAKWRAFGWTALEIDGHDIPAIEQALTQLPTEPGRPSVIVAHTVKGKGVSFMEDSLLWHYRSPDVGELARARAELEADP